MSKKSFSIDAAIAEEGQEPIIVELAGQEFPVQQGVSSASILRISRAKDGQKVLEAIDKMFEKMFGENYERFIDVCDEYNVPMETLEAILEWVQEQMTGRPTAHRPASLDSSQSTTSPSLVDATSQV